jgi:uncharacterized membrane protein YdjX (TVP38/TMEM64 family)
MGCNRAGFGIRKGKRRKQNGQNVSLNADHQDSKQSASGGKDALKRDERGAFRRFLPLGIALAGLGAVWASGLNSHLSPDSLAVHRATLKDVVAQHGGLSLAAFMLVYVAAVALSVPGAIVLTLLAGLLFGVVAGSIAVVVAATCGATLVFLIARSAIGGGLGRKAGPALGRILEGFRQDAVSYLLFLRLVPLFPFWLVNLAPALAGVCLRDFIWTTLVGIMPASIAFVAAGAGADSVIAAHGEAVAVCKAAGTVKAGCPATLDLSSLVTPQIGIALALLGIVALIPLVWRKIMPGPKA